MANFASAAERWLSKARQDLEAAERAAAPPPLTSVVCFHARQTAEKALKAVAASLGAETIPRTHSPLELSGLVAELGGESPVGDEELATLDPYAVQARYPDFHEPTVEAAEGALELAARLLGWAEDASHPPT